MYLIDKEGSVMTNRKTRRLQKVFEGTDFTVTKVIYEAAPLTPEPSVYLDESQRRWAVRFPGASPRIFSYDDVLACEIVEAKPREDSDAKADRLKELLKNPARVTRENAAKHGYCLGMGVVVAVRSHDTKGSIGHLQLPVVTRATKRDSVLFKRMVEYAEQLKAVFDTIREHVSRDDRDV